MEHEEDPFDTINNIQNQYYIQGYQKAKNDKELEEAAEKKQYYDQGFITGKQLGLELGYYCGYLEDLKQVLPIVEEYKKHQQKVEKLIEEIEQIILSIDPEQGTVDLDELPNTILLLRNKFKDLKSQTLILVETKVKIPLYKMTISLFEAKERKAYVLRKIMKTKQIIARQKV